MAGKDKDLCTVLRTVRIAQDLSTKNIADKMNVRTSYITDVERGDRTPSIATLDKYCEALNISTHNIFLWRDDQKNNHYSFQKLLMKILMAIEKLDSIQKEDEQILADLKRAEINWEIRIHFKIFEVSIWDD